MANDIGLVIKIDKDTYNNFICNEYSRVDVIAIHTALVNATPSETVTEFADRCRECGKQYVKRQTGHWIIDSSVDCYLDKVKCHCSECGKKKEFPADYDHIKQELSISYKHPDFIDNYCPNCGVKMEYPIEKER